MGIFKKKDEPKSKGQLNEELTIDMLLLKIIELEKKFASHSHVSPTANEGAPSPYPILKVKE